MILSIILFFVYTWGLGYSLTRTMKNSDDFYERNVMRIGFGLVFFAVLFTIMGWLHIPLDWKIILVLSLALPIYDLIKTKKIVFPTRVTKSNLYFFGALILFALTFFMYHRGAFIYPWLEDDDSWSHAYAVKYVKVEKSIFEPIKGVNTFQYMDAYPPIYDAIFGILHQTETSLMWTLKFFNALIISLSIPFFYFFAKEFIRDKNKGLFATFILAMVPSYLSHFIWAHALVPVFFIVTIYALEQIRHDSKWMYISMLMVTGSMLIHPIQGINLIIMFSIYFFVKAVLTKKIRTKHFYAIVIGILLSFAIWWVPMYLKYRGDFLTVGLSQKLQKGIVATAGQFTYIGRIGSAGRLYYYKDFFVAPTLNMINNPTGIGPVISILAFLALLSFLIYFFKVTIKRKKLFGKNHSLLIFLETAIATILLVAFIPSEYSWLAGVIFLTSLIVIYFIIARKIDPEQHSWKIITLLWLLFTYLGVHGGTRFPIALFSFRFWMLLAMPVSLIAAEGLWFLFLMGKKVNVSKSVILAVIMTTVFVTSGVQKYDINTAIWPPGGWLGQIGGEAEGFLWLKQLPPDTKIFVFSHLYAPVFGFDMFSCEWCPDVVEFRENPLNRTPQEIHSWLKSRGYEYTIFDYYLKRKYSMDFINVKITELIDSQLFIPVHQTSTVIVLKIV